MGFLKLVLLLGNAVALGVLAHLIANVKGLPRGEDAVLVYSMIALIGLNFVYVLLLTEGPREDSGGSLTGSMPRKLT